MAMFLQPMNWQRLEARRIAIIKPSALGDVVQALPLLPALRRRFPASHTTWIVQRELADLVTGHPDLDAVIRCDRRPTMSQVATLARELSQARFDLVFDLQGLLRSALMTWATRARYRIGLETTREGSHLATTHTIPGTTRDVPAHARYWRVAEALGVGDLPRRVLVQVPLSAQISAQKWLAGLPRPLIAVQWGAKWETKRWPVAGFADVLARAANTWGGTAVIVGAKADCAAAEEMTERIHAAAPHASVLDLSGRTTIKELAAVVSSVDAMFSNDSGPLHLAAELGTPSLGVFTCTSAVRSGPPGDAHEFVSTEVACAGSYHKTCPHTGEQHLACHHGLTAERVWMGLQRLVEKHAIVNVSRRAA